MPSHKYQRPKSKVIQVYEGKELETLFHSALQGTFSSEGIAVTQSQVRRFTGLLTQPALGGRPVLIIENFPLNSMQVRGKHKNLVYQVVTKTGNQYTRKFVKSKNPRTPLQEAQRAKLSNADKAWQSLTPAQKADWNKKAKNKPKSGYNLFVSNYLKTH